PPAPVLAILATPAGKRSDAQKAELRTYYRRQVSPEGRGLNARLAGLRREQAALGKQGPATMGMRGRPRPRAARVRVPRQYATRGEKVTAGVPAFLPPLPPGARPDRLGLARWLVRPDHPLTARVAVNRIWQIHFGTGLVKTAEDFGSQGDWPSHPELLDWLATEFVRSGWDVKALHRLILTSATYRQEARG